MNPQDIEEFAALHALGFLEGEERRRFERELETNPLARDALSRFARTTDLLALSADEMKPAQDLEDRIFDRLPPQEVQTIEGLAEDDRINESNRTILFLKWAPWGVAAGLAIACLALISDRAKQREAIEERDQLIANLERRGALDDIRIAVLKSRLENAPSASAVAVWDGEQQEGKLAVTDLPAVPPGKQYQLWIIDPAYESPVSAGVFNTDSDGNVQYTFSGSEAVELINAFALSVEVAGGSLVPEGPIVMVSE